MTETEIYDLLTDALLFWSLANLDMYQRTELDSIVDAASKKLAEEWERDGK